MNTPQFYTPAELEWIKKNAKDFTVRSIAFELGLGQSVIRNIGTRYGLTFKCSPFPNGIRPRARDPKLIPDPARSAYDRPPALYNQIGSPYNIASEMRKL